jgi:hypothetical protein
LINDLGKLIYIDYEIVLKTGDCFGAGRLCDKRTADPEPAVPACRTKRNIVRNGGSLVKARQIPPLLVNIVQSALQTCEGVRFHAGTTCGRCGGTLSGYDEREKRFAILIEDDVPHPVYVIIQRSYCRSCGRISVPQEPFYPGTRIGSPVVDLCRALSTTLPYSRVSSYLSRMGVQVDRWSVRSYARAPLPDIPAVDIFGMRIPVSIVTLSTLAGSGKETANPGMDDVLAACNYPSVARIAREPPARESGTGI